MLEFDFDFIAGEIKKRNAKIVAVQLPEGLKQNALEIAETLEEKSSAKIAIFVDPCFGACDLADSRALGIGADFLVHFGHTEFALSEFPVLYVPLKYSIPESKLKAVGEKLVRVLASKGAEKIALCTTVQYLHLLADLKNIIEGAGKGMQVFIGKGNNVERGQILGCNYSAVKEAGKEAGEEADTVVYFGDGLFHPLGIAFSNNSRVVVANPRSCEVKILGKEKDAFLRKRSAVIASAMDAKNFGIAVSTKKGQNRFGKALELKEKIEERGRKAFVLVSDFISQEYFIGMGLEVIVSTACPRIATDDAELFKVPVVSPSELLIILGERKFEDYKIEEFS